MGRKKKAMQPKEEIAEDFCFVCKDGGFLQICDFRDCLKAYHPHCVGNDQSILETETEWNCRWHSCFICQKSSSYRCLCCPISVCGRCIRRDAEFVLIKKKKTGLCNNCLKLAIMIEEKADVDSDGGKVDFQDRTTSEYLFKDYWEIVNEKEGLTLEDLHAADSRLKRHQVFESGSESDADEVLEEEMLAEADLCLRDSCSGMKTPTKRYKSKKKTLLAWSSDESLEEGENSKKPRRILSDSGPKSEQNHCKKKVTEQPKSEYAAIVEKNINSLYLRKSLALKLLGDPETFEHKVRGCFVRVRVDPKNFYSFPFKLYQLGQVKGVKKVDHAYQVGEVNTDIVLCITNMNDVHISMLSDEDIEEEDCEDLRQMVKKGTFKRPSIAELDKKIRSMHRDIMSHWIDRELSRLAKKIERANDKGWRAELFNLIDERELLRTPKEQNRLLDEIPSIIADMEDLPAAALEITSMEIDDVHVAALETISVEIEGNTSASVEKVGVEVAKGNTSASVEKVGVEVAKGNTSAYVEKVGVEVAKGNTSASVEKVGVEVAKGITCASVEKVGVEVAKGNTSASVEKVGVEVAKGGVNATSMEVSVQEVEDGHATARDAFLLDVEVLAVQTDTKQNNPLEVIDRNGLNVQSESEKNLLDAHGTNILSIKSESAKQHEPLDSEMTNSSRSSIKRKSDMKQDMPLEFIDSNGLNIQSESGKKLKSLDADKPLDDEVISSSRLSTESEFKEKLLEARVQSESAKQDKSLYTEINSSSRSCIRRKSDALKAFSPDVEDLPVQTGESLSADAININRSSIDGEFKEKLLDVQGTNKPLAAEVMSTSRSSIKSKSKQKLLNLSVRPEANRVKRNRSSVQSRRTMAKINSADIICLDDDSDDPETPKIGLNDDDAAQYAYPETLRIWHYKDPLGGVQGPFTKEELRHWNGRGYFTADFRVWSSGRSADASVLLADLLRH